MSHCITDKALEILYNDDRQGDTVIGLFQRYIRVIYNTEGLLTATKTYRNFTGLTLKEAKEAVEDLVGLERNTPLIPDPTPDRCRSCGCAIEAKRGWCDNCTECPADSDTVKKETSKVTHEVAIDALRLLKENDKQYHGLLAKLVMGILSEKPLIFAADAYREVVGCTLELAKEAVEEIVED